MAYELLKKITDGALPVTMTAQADIEKLRVLRDAGYVKASIPPVDSGSVFSTSPAVVTAVTPLGRTAMRYFGNS